MDEKEFNYLLDEYVNESKYKNPPKIVVSMSDRFSLKANPKGKLTLLQSSDHSWLYVKFINLSLPVLLLELLLILYLEAIRL